jgi:hypothetical protein
MSMPKEIRGVFLIQSRQEERTAVSTYGLGGVISWLSG